MKVVKVSSSDASPTSLRISALAVPSVFTVQLWVRHVESLTTNTVKTIVYQSGRFVWTYNAATNGYEVTLGSTTVSTMSVSSVVFGKWIHYTIIHDTSDKLDMYRYGETPTVIQETTVTFLGSSATIDIYLGTSSSPSDGTRFDGYLREFRLWDIALTVAQAKANFDRELTTVEVGSDLILYYPLDGTVGIIDLVSESTAYVTNSHTISTVYDDPVCCKRGQSCTSRTFDGVACSTENTYLYFNGRNYVILPTQTIAATDFVFVSFWFKPLLESSVLTVSALFSMESIATIYYNRSGVEDNKLGMATIVMQHPGTTVGEKDLLIPRQMNVWYQVIATFVANTGVITLSVPGAYNLSSIRYINE